MAENSDDKFRISFKYFKQKQSKDESDVLSFENDSAFLENVSFMVFSRYGERLVL